MQVVFGKSVADQLRDRYTVLELETFTVDDKQLEAFCIVPAESIPFDEMAKLADLTQLHDDFIVALKSENYEICRNLFVDLIGKFGGEMDSFYMEIAKRISKI